MFKTTNCLIKLILVLDSIVHGNSHRDVMVRLILWQALHAVHRVWEDVLEDLIHSKVILLRHVILSVLFSPSRKGFLVEFVALKALWEWYICCLQQPSGLMRQLKTEVKLATDALDFGHRHVLAVIVQSAQAVVECRIACGIAPAGEAAKVFISLHQSKFAS